MAKLLSLLAVAQLGAAIDNGLGRTPPRLGWVGLGGLGVWLCARGGGCRGGGVLTAGCMGRGLLGVLTTGCVGLLVSDTLWFHLLSMCPGGEPQSKRPNRIPTIRTHKGVD